MKQPTLSILTAAVILAPLTALAQKTERKSNITDSSNSIPINYPETQINHNAYGVPLVPTALSDNETEKAKDSGEPISTQRSRE